MCISSWIPEPVPSVRTGDERLACHHALCHGAVATVVGEAGGNILEVSHNRMMMGISAKSATLALVIEARDAEHGAAIRQKLSEGGFPLA